MSAITLDRAMNIAAAVRPETRAFVDGEYVRAKGGATFATINPATGQSIVEVAHCMAEDVDAAVRAARSAFEAGPGAAPRPKRARKCC